MNKYWLLVVLIALIITAIVEQCCQRECFDPVIEHSEIKAGYRSVKAWHIKWIIYQGDAYGHIVPKVDSVFVEDY